MSFGYFAIAVVLTPILTLLLRVFYLVYQIINTECELQSQQTSLRTILCIGSGGHTTELLRLMKNLDPTKYSPRLYVVADNDISSEVKIHKLEKEIGSRDYVLARIPRSRNVKQSYASSIGSTLYATLCTVPVVCKFKPQVVLCNGPGTCIPVCIIAFLMRCLFVTDCRIIFIESVCRVRSFSLTGKILQWFADVIVVQWPFLREICSRAKYFGRLM